MGAASYLLGATNAASPGRRADNSGRAVDRTRAEGRARLARAPVGPEVGRSDALVAAEGLGELRGLAVADAVGDLAHGQRARGQHVSGLLHADPGEVVAEGGLADL